MPKTVATAEQIYADPSALCRLYIHHERAWRELAAWRRRTPGVLKVTEHGRAEIVNAIALAAHRGAISNKDAEDAWASLESDFSDGHLVRADILWRAHSLAPAS